MRTGLYKGLSNEELVELYKAGESDAFEALLKNTEGLRATLAQRYLNIPGSEFEDLMSEGAIEMLSAIQNFDSKNYSSSFSTFLYSAISRHYNDMFTAAVCEKRNPGCFVQSYEQVNSNSEYEEDGDSLSVLSRTDLLSMIWMYMRYISWMLMDQEETELYFAKERAGGLSEGFIQAGFSPVAHVEMNPYAAQTLETRTGYYYLKAQGKLDIYKDYISGKITRDEFLQHIPEEQLQSVFCETMSNETLPRLFENIDRILTQRGIKQVDVIIGGPPCQAYSLVGRAQSKHMETPMSADPRNDLYKLYARFLQKYHPKMFVFENVMGIKSANSGATWLKVQEALRSVGYEIECHEQNSKNFGVLQNRRRMIIVGWLKNTGLSYPQFEQTIADATVNDILSDLPALQPGGKSGEYRSDDFSDYLRSTGIRKDSDILTHHCARPNKDRDIEIYRRTIELWNDGHKRLNYNDLPDELKTHKNRKSFLDRFKVVEGDEAYCHTMLAHISKDGHYFIHPDIEQHRSITVREAARIQSFPDDYFFEGPRTAQFVQMTCN